MPISFYSYFLKLQILIPECLSVQFNTQLHLTEHTALRPIAVQCQKPVLQCSIHNCTTQSTERSAQQQCSARHLHCSVQYTAALHRAQSAPSSSSAVQCSARHLHCNVQYTTALHRAQSAPPNSSAVPDSCTAMFNTQLHYTEHRALRPAAVQCQTPALHCCRIKY